MKLILITVNSLSFLIKVISDNWGYLLPGIYNQLSPDISREVYLHIPLNFLPEHYIKNKAFIDTWLSINEHKRIQFNNNTYITLTKFYPNFDDDVLDYTQHYSQDVEYWACNAQNQDRTELNYHKSAIDHIHLSYDGLTQTPYLQDRIHYHYYKIHGMWTSWYVGGRVSSEQEYNMGVTVGPERWHFENGNVKTHD